ncbi:MAG: NUDIX hydrolase [Nanobdellota archaeon]
MKVELTVAGYIIDNNKVLLVHHRKLDLWLPVGGHIDDNETPDDALIREVKEELGIDIQILNQSNMPLGGNIKYNLAMPFYTNVHSVGDHDHYTLFYICKALNPNQLKINKELKDFEWFTKDDLHREHVPVHVGNQALKALELYNQL